MFRIWLWISASVLILGFLAVSWKDNHQAKMHDGEITGQICPQRLPFFLPDELHESSGLVWFDGLFWSMNDSGNEPALYAVNKQTGQLVRTVFISDAVNTDWEDITMDEHYLYIGDIGNNDGTRRDLCIYRIPLNILADTNMKTVHAEKIEFYYASQKDYQASLFKTPWDAESFLVWQDTVYVFTKDWVNEGSRVFLFPATVGSHKAIECNRIQVDGILTGAGYNAETNRIAFCGYKDYQPFLAFSSWDSIKTVPGIKLEKMSCDSLYGIQVEAITSVPRDGWYISCELSVIPPSLFFFSESLFEHSHQ